MLTILNPICKSSKLPAIIMILKDVSTISPNISPVKISFMAYVIK